MPAKKPIAELPKLTGIGKPKKAPQMKRFPIAPRGWEHLKLGVRPALVGTGWGEPPVGFVGARTSREEWIVYWAISKYFNDPTDPRQPPFTGSRVGNWFYQVQEAGGRVPAGSVSDFQVKTPLGWMIWRLDTERWHIFANANVQMRDLFLKTHIRTGKVLTLYSQHFLGDKTGQAVMKVVALAMKGIELMNPIRSGTALRVREPGR